MAGSFSQLTLLGHVGRDPEARTTPNGKSIVSFPLAVNRRGRDGQEETDSWSVEILSEKVGEIATRFLTKGRQALVVGEPRLRKYVDKQGVEKTVTECVIGFQGSLTLVGGQGDAQGAPQDGGARGQPASRPGPSAGRQQAYGGGGRPAARRIEDDLDDSIPFLHEPQEMLHRKLHRLHGSDPCPL